MIHSGVARNLIGVGVYVLTSHCNFKTCVNAPHVNKTDFGGIYADIYPRRYAPGDSRLVTLDEILLQKVVSTDVTPSATKQQMT